jgi:hypothetical protein
VPARALRPGAPRAQQVARPVRGRRAPLRPRAPSPPGWLRAGAKPARPRAPNQRAASSEALDAVTRVVESPRLFSAGAWPRARRERAYQRAAPPRRAELPAASCISSTRYCASASPCSASGRQDSERVRHLRAVTRSSRSASARAREDARKGSARSHRPAPRAGTGTHGQRYRIAIRSPLRRPGKGARDSSSIRGHPQERMGAERSGRRGKARRPRDPGPGRPRIFLFDVWNVGRGSISCRARALEDARRRTRAARARRRRGRERTASSPRPSSW